jgi:hypothetical protein
VNRTTPAIIIYLLLFSTCAMANTVIGSLGWNGGVNDNPHNLSSLSTAAIHAPAGGEEQICIFCHTPHGASAQSTLWNRPDLLNATYPLYSGDLVINETFNPPGSAGTLVLSKYSNSDPLIQYPNGSSRMCMSCHDGVTAVGTVLNGGALANLTMSAAGTIDLSASHPISFVYTQAVVDKVNGSRGGLQYQLPATASRAPLDGSQRVQCTTCHEPHFDTRHDGSYPFPFWRNAGRGFPAGSAADYDLTCNQCHLSPAVWDPPLETPPRSVHGDGQ